MAPGKRPATFRTWKLSPAAPMVLQPIGCGRVGHRHNTTKPEGRHRHTACRPSPFQHPTPHPPPARHQQRHQRRQWLRYQQRHERQRTTPARRPIHESRMQFPQHRAPPRNHTVGIATLTHTIENSPNRIARKTTPSTLPASLPPHTRGPSNPRVGGAAPKRALTDSKRGELRLEGRMVELAPRRGRHQRGEMHQ